MKQKNSNNKADQSNSNPDTSGANRAYQKVLDNRSNQLNPNNPLFNKPKGK